MILLTSIDLNILSELSTNSWSDFFTKYFSFSKRDPTSAKFKKEFENGSVPELDNLFKAINALNPITVVEKQKPETDSDALNPKPVAAVEEKQSQKELKRTDSEELIAIAKDTIDSTRAKTIQLAKKAEEIEAALKLKNDDFNSQKENKDLLEELEQYKNLLNEEKISLPKDLKRENLDIIITNLKNELESERKKVSPHALSCAQDALKSFQAMENPSSALAPK